MWAVYFFANGFNGLILLVMQVFGEQVRAHGALVGWERHWSANSCNELVSLFSGQYTRGLLELRTQVCSNLRASCQGPGHTTGVHILWHSIPLVAGNSIPVLYLKGRNITLKRFTAQRDQLLFTDSHITGVWLRDSKSLLFKLEMENIWVLADLIMLRRRYNSAKRVPVASTY